ncbi:EGF-like domain-containing protein [Caenorhabditis elegans]|uniref:EGF-like domain-containing protein n=1 Tax=Caenorhabditis elegans TaxID=6239 RepID=Q17657_CAEEL|nr:EGF-like domain-containing protein [Caenorhabditis elegans]CAA90754.3 EGF-like domain-containing protein [Caenorhabditis elegans]|eukprot:NP_001352242.1 Uncharacterized protein CELE_C05D12.2 [Caenorhabditis elegans]
MTTKQWCSIIFIVVLVFLQEITCQSAKCQNFGTPLNSTDCKCPAYVDGKLCENIKCQRWSVPDKNRCACAPGWYDRYCGLRGCRPPNEEQMDLEKRSFIIVFNTKTTMKMQLDTLMKNFKEMISRVSKNPKGVMDNWIENFIIYGFVQSQSNTKIQKLFTENPDDVISFFNNMTLSDGDDTQPVLTAIQNAQQTYPKMKSHALVLVFTDSTSSDATAWSHRFTDKNSEQSVLQISLLWRSKYSFFLSLPSPANFSSNGVDVYRRLSLTNHGDTFFIKDSKDLSNALLNVIGVQYFPENVQVGYGKTADEQLNTYVDNDGDLAYILLTIRPSSQAEIPSIDEATTVAEGDSYRLYSRASKIGDTVTIFCQNGTTYNYRMFIQSKNTLLFNYNDDMHIDVGNGMAVIGIEMFSTMQTYGFPQWQNSSYDVRSFDGKLLREKFYASARPQQDCTFLYGFPAWKTLPCPPGPITQLHTFYYNGYNQQRTTPGYCIKIDHQNSSNIAESLEELTTKISKNNTDTCSKKNVDSINDPRLQEPKQFIFILEQHSGNEQIYKTLTTEMHKILELVNSSTTSEYRKEFTLIVHDSEESHVLFSSYNPDIFVEKFPNLVNSLKLTDNLDNTMGLLSIIHAQKMNILPTAQVYYFANQAVKNVQNLTRNWDLVKRDIEINFFTIADGVTTETFALPNQLELIRKMTNGRLIPLGKTENSILPIFNNMMKVTTLTTDEIQDNCYDNPLEIDGYFEDGADFSVVQVVGTGLQNIKMQDSNGTIVTNSEFIAYKNPNFILFRIDSKLFASGVWKLSALSTTGGCQITVRQKTSIGLVLGFTEDINDDNVSTQIISQRSSSDSMPIYIPMKVTSGIIPTSLEIKTIPRLGHQPVNYKKLAVARRDASSCSYNFISDSVVVPKTELTTWTVSAESVGKLVLHRIFHYYQHLPADSSVCQGGNVDKFGRCICPSRYTGDYCWDRICHPPATYSFGICSCPPGFYGDFCEIMLVLPKNGSILVRTTTLETTGNISTSGFSIITVLLTFIYCHIF